MSEIEKHVETLVLKAASSDRAADAMQFSQAACNAANALCALGAAKREAAK